MIIENLENRTLLSASLSNGGLLSVTDNSGNDSILIKKVNAQVQVAINNVVTNFIASKIKSIIAGSKKGDDKITVDKSLSVPVTLYAGTGNDSLYGGAGTNVIIGGPGNDLLVGGDQYDYIEGGTGNSTLSGFGGSDYLVGGLGNNTYVFNPTYTSSLVTLVQKPNNKLATLDFTALNSDEALTVDLTSDNAIAAYSKRTIRTGGAGQAARFGTVIGGAGKNKITGNPAADVLIGGTGITTLVAGAGASTLKAGTGQTTFVFGPKSAALVPPLVTPIDFVIPNIKLSSLDFSQMPSNIPVTVDLTSDAALASYPGRLIQTGGPGQAAFFATVLGGAGDDSITGNAIPNYLSGIAGNDRIIPGSADSLLVGGIGNTAYIFKPQSAAVVYTVDEDTFGTNGFDFSALPADNPVTVNLGSDILATYTNVTIKTASAGEWQHLNTVTGGAGDDSITANNFGDTIYVGTGNATVNGGTGADFILVPSGTGQDLISGNGGADLIIAAGGDSTIYATNSADDPYLNDGIAQNVAAPAVANTSNTGAVIIVGAGNDSIVGTNKDDTIEGGAGSVTIHGLGGNDYIQGGQLGSKIFADSGNSTIYGGPGPDTISGGTGIVEIHGGDGGNFIDKNLPDDSSTAGPDSFIDTYIITLAAIDFAQGGSGTVFFGETASTAISESGGFTSYPLVGPTGPGDSVDGGTGDSTLIGGRGDDTLFGGNGNTTTVAGSGNVALVGGDGENTQQGGAGSDTFSTGEGPDTMTGGTGDGIFLNDNGYPNVVTGGDGLNSAEIDPTGQTSYDNIQVFHLVDQQPFGEIGIRSFGDTAAPPIAAVSNVVPPPVALSPAFIDGNHYIEVGDPSFTGNQAVAITQDAVGNITLNQVGTGFQNFANNLGIVGVIVYGGSGNDTVDIRQFKLKSSVNSGDGNNSVFGGLGNDTIITGSGNDLITEISGNNVIYSGLGNDNITGGSGSDWLNPNAYGFFQSNVTSSDTITGGSGTEYLDYNYNADNITVRLDQHYAFDGNTGIVSFINNIHKVFMGNGAATYAVGDSSGACMITAGSGADTIFGIGGHDYLSGGPGNDYVFETGTNSILSLKSQHNNNTNKHHYNAGTGKSTAYIDATDLLVALQHPI